MKDRIEDRYTYGSRLLKGMGWSEGKGLGKNEDGMKEALKVKKKFNTKGMGFNGVDDKWVEHQEAFDQILSQLNGGADPEDGKPKLISIEERSRTMGGRVHYSKFLRGKDLSQKKDDDLKAIFVSHKRKKGKDVEDGEPGPDGDSADAEVLYKTHKSSLSYQDYFAQQMKLKRQAQGNTDDPRGRGQASTMHPNLETGGESEDARGRDEARVAEDGHSTSSKKESKKRDKNVEDDGQSTSSKKRSKKRDKNVEDVHTSAAEDGRSRGEYEEAVSSKKKKKRKDKRREEESLSSQERKGSDSEVYEEGVHLKKKKGGASEDDDVPARKKRHKGSLREEDRVVNDGNEAAVRNSICKAIQKSLQKEGTADARQEDVYATVDTVPPKEKKRRAREKSIDDGLSGNRSPECSFELPREGDSLLKNEKRHKEKKRRKQKSHETDNVTKEGECSAEQVDSTAKSSKKNKIGRTAREAEGKNFYDENGFGGGGDAAVRCNVEKSALTAKRGELNGIECRESGTKRRKAKVEVIVEEDTNGGFEEGGGTWLPEKLEMAEGDAKRKKKSTRKAQNEEEETEAQGAINDRREDEENEAKIKRQKRKGPQDTWEADEEPNEKRTLSANNRKRGETCATEGGGESSAMEATCGRDDGSACGCSTNLGRKSPAVEDEARKPRTSGGVTVEEHGTKKKAGANVCVKNKKIKHAEVKMVCVDSGETLATVKEDKKKKGKLDGTVEAEKPGTKKVIRAKEGSVTVEGKGTKKKEERDGTVTRTKNKTRENTGSTSEARGGTPAEDRKGTKKSGKPDGTVGRTRAGSTKEASRGKSIKQKNVTAPCKHATKTSGNTVKGGKTRAKSTASTEKNTERVAQKSTKKTTARGVKDSNDSSSDKAAAEAVPVTAAEASAFAHQIVNDRRLQPAKFKVHKQEYLRCLIRDLGTTFSGTNLRDLPGYATTDWLDQCVLRVARALRDEGVS